MRNVLGFEKERKENQIPLPRNKRKKKPLIITANQTLEWYMP